MFRKHDLHAVEIRFWAYNLAYSAFCQLLQQKFTLC